MKLLSGGYWIFAASRFWIASATSFGGLLCAAEQACIVSSPVEARRPVGGRGREGGLDRGIRLGGLDLLLRQRGRGGERNEDRESVTHGHPPLALETGRGDFTARGLLGEVRDQRDARRPIPSGFRACASASNSRTGGAASSSHGWMTRDRPAIRRPPSRLPSCPRGRAGPGGECAGRSWRGRSRRQSRTDRSGG